MARTRYFFFESLRRIGTSLFNFFSRCEDCGILPRASRWVKTTFLGAFVTGITALSATSMLNCIHCYAPIDTQPYIENATATPNPTAGTDTVTISAHAYMQNPPAEYNIARAVFVIDNDTTDMQAADGNFDSQDEEITAKLYVGAMTSDTVKIKVSVANNNNEWGDPQEIDLEITE